MAESGGGEGNKRRKLHDIEDRISALPNSIIHHILSLLPSTKEAVRTGILSKRWKDQWTHVPVLMFHSRGMQEESFFKFTENALIVYNCFKIKKFLIEYAGAFKQDPQFSAKIQFATRRNVEELILICDCSFGRYKLPQFLFNQSSLVKLRTENCIYMPYGRVNWECLKELCLCRCELRNQAIKSVLSGSPLLEILIVNLCHGFDQLVIASKSLKRMVLCDLRNYVLGISCPKLELLHLEASTFGNFRLSNQVIANILSSNPLLKRLTLSNCDGFDQLVIATESLRILVLKKLKVSAIEISCPNLQKLELENVDNMVSFKLMNVPSSSSSASGFRIDWRKGLFHWKRSFSSVQQSRS